MAENVNVSGKNKHSANLDILRGLLALIVVVAHLNSDPLHFDKAYGTLFSIFYNFPGNLCVLVFFILSGYVIGLNHPTLENKEMIWTYIKKRVVRIAPIYSIAILFTVVFSREHYTWQVVLSNLLYLSVPAGNLMDDAFPIWSLHYEMVCYGIFIFIAYFKLSLPRTLQVLFAATALLFVFFHNAAVHPLVLTYLIGYIFWLTGAMLAQIKTFPHWDISHSRIMALFLLMFCVQNLTPYGPILKALHISTMDYKAYDWYKAKILYSDLFFYPLTVLLILALTHSYSRVARFLIYFTFGALLFRLVMLIKVYGLHYIIDGHFVIPVSVLFVSIVLWFLNFRLSEGAKKVVGYTASLSAISYAIYIIHVPLMRCMGLYTAPSFPIYVLKFIVYWILLIGVSYVLEMKFQPFVKQLVFGKPVRKPSPGQSADVKH